MEEHILRRIREYTEAVYQLDFKKLVDQYFYKPDLKEYYTNIIWLAEKMEPFGESDGFLRIFSGIKTVEELKQMPMEEFIAAFLSGGVKQMGEDGLEAMMKSIRVLRLEKKEEVVLVEYELDNVFAEGQGKIKSHLEVIEVEGEWYFKFRSGMDAVMDSFKGRIDDYQERAKKDKIELGESVDLEPYALYGYRDYEDQTVIEPRFKEAGDFHEGLAYAKVFSKYGYINKQGKFAIRPRFDKAFDFAEDGLAKVGKYDEEFDAYYGYVDREGRQVIPCIYKAANNFCEELAAVKLHNKWGFINTKGEVVIEISYDEVYDFEDGEARLIKEMDDYYKEFVVDTKGNVLDSTEGHYD